MASQRSIVIIKAQKGFEWHMEDAWAISRQYPIFTVADGVTLPATMYPDTGAKDVAEIFCREIVKFLEPNFHHLSRELITEAYLRANHLVSDYNQRRKLFDYAAVGVLAAITDGQIWGSRVTDCGFALIRQGQLIFKTPEFWREARDKGRDGYGVLNGQPGLEKQIDFYTRDYQSGDYLCLFSDGFENHFDDKDFLGLFESDLITIKNKIEMLDKKLVEQDGEKFGHERTLLIIKLEKTLDSKLESSVATS